MLAEPAAGEQRAQELAAGQTSKLPHLFQDDDFVALSAGLSLAVVELRREADGPAAAAGLSAIAWLQLHRPDWRERLPLSTGEGAAEALIEDLMKAEAVTGSAVAAERLLQREGDGRREVVRLILDGIVDGATARAPDPACGRLRMFAAGEMAWVIPDELAMLKPPGEGQTA